MVEKMSGQRNGQGQIKGFTMIEVIAVIVVIAILLAVAVSRVVSPTNTSLIAENDILKAHLRYAQYRAMGDVTLWCMSFAANTYTLWNYDSSASQWKPSTLPNEDSGTHSLQKAGVSITVTGGDGTSIYFNEWGSPVNASDVLLTNPKIVLSAEGDAQTITITPNTGFIP